MKNVEFYVGVQVIQDKFVICSANPDMPLARALPDILRQIQGENTGSPPSDYKILIAHQVTDVNEQSIRELNLGNGDYLFIYRPSLASTSLQLIPPNRFKGIHPGWVIEKQEVLVGRQGESNPDIDLTPLLRDSTRVSRKLAWMKEEKDRWTMRLHEEGRSHVYVDNTRLEVGKSLDLLDGTIISFGSNLQEPDLRLQVRLNTH